MAAAFAPVAAPAALGHHSLRGVGGTRARHWTSAHWNYYWVRDPEGRAVLDERFTEGTGVVLTKVAKLVQGHYRGGVGCERGGQRLQSGLSIPRSIEPVGGMAKEERVKKLETHVWWPKLVQLKDEMSLQELGERLGVSAQAVARALKRTGTLRERAPPGPRARRQERLPLEPGEGTAAPALSCHLCTSHVSFFQARRRNALREEKSPVCR